jgi:hypothetical protein
MFPLLVFPGKFLLTFLTVDVDIPLTFQVDSQNIQWNDPFLKHELDFFDTSQFIFRVMMMIMLHFYLLSCTVLDMRCDDNVWKMWNVFSSHLSSTIKGESTLLLQGAFGEHFKASCLFLIQEIAFLCDFIAGKNVL